ncbi:hypothetical protein AAC387_Pa06g2409 [Persea americana]
MGNYSSATLTDSGNLVLTDGRGVILWESFDYPTSTFLPGMKLGLSLRTGLSWFLTSWKSVDDPAPGEFTLSLDPLGTPQYFVRMGSDLWMDSGSFGKLMWSNKNRRWDLMWLAAQDRCD